MQLYSTVAGGGQRGEDRRRQCQRGGSGGVSPMYIGFSELLSLITSEPPKGRFHEEKAADLLDFAQIQPKKTVLSSNY